MNKLGIGKEAKVISEFPMRLQAARAEGRSEAILEVQKGAGMKYHDMSKVTPEKIGRDLINMGKGEIEKALFEAKQPPRIDHREDARCPSLSLSSVLEYMLSWLSSDKATKASIGKIPPS